MCARLGWGHREWEARSSSAQLLPVYTLCAARAVPDPLVCGAELPRRAGRAVWCALAAGSGVADSCRRGAALKKQAGVVSAMVTLWEGLFALPFALQTCPALRDFYSWEQGRSRLCTPGEGAALADRQHIVLLLHCSKLFLGTWLC